MNTTDKNFKITEERLNNAIEEMCRENITRFKPLAFTVLKDIFKHRNIDITDKEIQDAFSYYETNIMKVSLYYEEFVKQIIKYITNIQKTNK